jgi:hypothetical protein
MTKHATYHGREVVGVSYDGNDLMINSFSKDAPIPEVHKDFKAHLRLKNGILVDATPNWRKKIWTWFVEERRKEIESAVVTLKVRTLGRKK